MRSRSGSTGSSSGASSSSSTWTPALSAWPTVTSSASGSCVWTLPLTLLPDLCGSLPQHVQEACGRLRYQGILNINLGVDRPELSDFHWVYFYEDGFPFHRLSFPGMFSPNNVPAGKSSVATEVAFRPGEPPDHERAVEETIAALRRSGILRVDDRIELVNVQEIAPAYVIYDLEHAATVEIVRGWLAEQGI